MGRGVPNHTEPGNPHPSPATLPLKGGGSFILTPPIACGRHCHSANASSSSTNAREDEPQIPPDRQELQVVQHVAGPGHAAGDRRIDRVPHRIADRLDDACRRHVARRRHRHRLARAEHQRAEHAADRLGEAAGGVLRRRAGIGEAAIPCRPAAQRVRGEAMHRQRRQPRRPRDEHEHQQPVIRTAALRDRHDGQPVQPDLRRHPRAGQRLRHRRQPVDHQRPAARPPAGTARPGRPSPPAKSRPPRAPALPPCCAAGRGS